MGAEELAAAPPKEEQGAPPEKTEDQKKGDEEKGEEKKKEEEEAAPPPKPPAPFVLYIDLHCVGCAKKIEKSIMKMRGVEGVSIEMESNQVTIKGVVEPEAVCAKLMKRTKRMVRILSPLPASDGEPIPEVLSSQVTALVTVELNVNMHCEACAQQLRKKILKMRGVRTATTELSSEKVTVTGTMDANKLVDYVYRHTKKQAKIVPQPEPDQKPAPEEENKKEEPKPDQGEKNESEGGDAAAADQKKEDDAGAGEGEKKQEAAAAGGEEKKEEESEQVAMMNITEEQAMQRMVYYYQPLYVMERIPPPQLFSDENPNACSIT